METKKRLIDSYVLTVEVKKSLRYNPHPPGLVRVNHRNEHVHFLRMIYDAPTVDAVEVVHGRWSETMITGGFAEEWGYVCSVCGCTVSDRSRLGKYQGSNQQLNYCPNCGAKMEGGNEDG